MSHDSISTSKFTIDSWMEDIIENIRPQRAINKQDDSRKDGLDDDKELAAWMAKGEEANKNKANDKKERSTPTIFKIIKRLEGDNNDLLCYDEEDGLYVNDEIKLTKLNRLFPNKASQAGRKEFIRLLEDSFGETVTNSTLKVLGLHKRGAISFIQAENLVRIAARKFKEIQSSEIEYDKLIKIIGEKSNDSVTVQKNIDPDIDLGNDDKYYHARRKGLNCVYRACANSFGPNKATLAFHKLGLQAGTKDRIGQELGYKFSLTNSEAHDLSKEIARINNNPSPFEKFAIKYGVEPASVAFEMERVSQDIKNIETLDERTLEHLKRACEVYSQYQPQNISK
jgi:hypothetical protein